jgi:hypothetical protein
LGSLALASLFIVGNARNLAGALREALATARVAALPVIASARNERC